MNKIWRWILIVICVFVAMPLLLRLSFIRFLVTWFLQPLDDVGYKSIYIETLGALLGTFLAVVGALWVQRKVDMTEEEKTERETALVVFYDFFFASNEIIKFMQEYHSCDLRMLTNVVLDWENYKKRKKKHQLYIDAAWIHNVAKLSNVLEPTEIQKIYELYGDLSTIQKTFDLLSNSVSKEEDQAAFSIMLKKFCCTTMSLDGSRSITVTLKPDVQEIIDKLKQKAKIYDEQVVGSEN